jgi:phage gp36-like protein
MAYITNADIEERLGSAAYVQLTDDDGNGLADTGVVDEARQAAEGEVNSYLARRYQVPIDLSEHSELADLLASVTLDLVEYRLRLRRPPVPKDVVDRHTRAVDWLTGVADARIELPSAAPLAANPALGTLGEAIGEERLLSRDELSDY